jgi:hypothetical protein
MKSHTIPKQDSLLTFICSSVAGVVSHAVAYPLNTILGRLEDNKVKIKTVKQLPEILLADSYRQTRYEQLRALYKGFLASGVHKIGSRTIKYGCQPIVADHLGRAVNLNEDSHPVKKMVVESGAGAITSSIQYGLFYPLDTIKTRRQSAINVPAWQMIKTEKLDLYAGLHLAIASKMLGAIVLFGMTSIILSAQGVKTESEATFWQTAVATNIAATADALVTNPIAVIKERLQLLQPKMKVSPISLFHQIVKEEGVSALYKGAVPNIVSSFPRKALPLAISSWMMAKLR